MDGTLDLVIKYRLKPSHALANQWLKLVFLGREVLDISFNLSLTGVGRYDVVFVMV